MVVGVGGSGSVLLRLRFFLIDESGGLRFFLYFGPSALISGA